MCHAGTAVYIMRGPGMGQWRRVTGNTGRHWQIERPFTVPPVPGLSVVNIASLRAFHIWEHNTVSDAGALQVCERESAAVGHPNAIEVANGYVQLLDTC